MAKMTGNRLAPDRPKEKRRRSPYRPARILGIVIFAVTFCWVAAGAYVGFVENTDQEYCDYVGPDEPYHLIMDDTPCRITWTAVSEPFLFLTLANVLLQPLTLILWAILAYRERWRRARARSTSENRP